MTWNEFWYDDPQLFWYFQQKHVLEQERLDFNDHKLAGYFRLAIMDAIQFSKHPKKIFPAEPFSQTAKNKYKTIEEENKMWEDYILSKVKLVNSQKK